MAPLPPNIDGQATVHQQQSSRTSTHPVELTSCRDRMTEGGVTREHDRQISVLVAPSESTAMQLVNPNKVNKIHDPQDLIQLATFVQSADNYTKSVVGGKLEQISESIRHLQAQAQEVLASAKRDVEVGVAGCGHVVASRHARRQTAVDHRPHPACMVHRAAQPRKVQLQEDSRENLPPVSTGGHR